MSYSGRELSQAWGALASGYDEERRGLDEASGRCTKLVAENSVALTEAGTELGAVFVTELTAEALAEAERRTGFRGFSRFNPLAAMAREDAVLAADIARMEGDPSYQRREELVGPGGSVTRQIAETGESQAAWQKECDRFESLEGFAQLLEAKYDTPEFEQRWWKPDYWRLWSAGDRICRDLGLADFGDDVLPAYRQASGPRDTYAMELMRLTAERDAVHELVRKHDAAVRRRQDLERIYLDECQRALGAHLVSVDALLLLQWAGSDRAVQVVLQKIAGLKAKVEYGSDLRENVSSEIAALDSRKAKARAKSVKFGRSKHASSTFDPKLYPERETAALPKLRARREKLLGVTERISRFDDYERFDLRNDPALWWVAMTGRPPGAYSPDLQQWYDRHPDVAAGLVDRTEHATATALAAADTAHHDLGDLS